MFDSGSDKTEIDLSVNEPQDVIFRNEYFGA